MSINKVYSVIATFSMGMLIFVAVACEAGEGGNTDATTNANGGAGGNGIAQMGGQAGTGTGGSTTGAGGNLATGGSGTMADPLTMEDCKALCEHQAKAMCPAFTQASCEESCNGSAKASACAREIREYVDCSMKEETTCDTDGDAIAAACAKLGQTAQTCVLGSLGQGGAGQGGSGGQAAGGDTGAGGNAAGGDTGAGGSTAAGIGASFADAVGASDKAKCAACLDAMTGSAAGDTVMCAGSSASCMADNDCMAMVDQVKVNRDGKPGDPADCWVVGAVGSSPNDATNTFATCAAEKCGADCGGLTAGYTSTCP